MPAVAQPRSQHPPLAHDARGFPIALPNGTASLGVKRQTTGRPKVVLGPNRQPLRLPLDSTTGDLLDLCGAGTFRIDAIDEAGQPLDFITTVTIGDGCGADAVEADPLPTMLAPRAVSSGNGSELRFALEVTAHMARAQSDALRSIANAQADWIKGLANAKVLGHRNGLWPMLPTPSSAGGDDDDEGDDDEDDEDETDDTPQDPMAGVNTMLGHVAGIAKHVSPLFTKAQPRNAAASEDKATAPTPVAQETPAPEPRNANPAASDAAANALHLTLVLDRLSPAASRITRAILGGKTAKARELVTVLSGMSIDQAVAELETLAADVGQKRRRAPAAAPSVDFATQLEAVKALLAPAEIVQVVAMISTIAPETLDAFKAKLMDMSPEDAAAFVRNALRDREGDHVGA